ncbi:Oidioi.mRNA.OKI2018_I69.XSR.g15998.t2.cds [Oikopleura dioica]|uniref:Oidioi.mRNA.OKI2018_I69.XSR.g15998.t2.cds n=1 Tax=Oikopleura dioica TaxID=34765 RepID=A0ABN7SGJ2_OIKDI|nr:Oidioi.mRNA.OKI2018_I69.XSR.g15998.t2.cds [Oikopleura dioica]
MLKSCEATKWPERPRYTLDMLGFSSDAVVYEVLKFPTKHENIFFRQGRDGFQRPRKLLLDCDPADLLKGAMASRSRKLFFLNVAEPSGELTLKWVPYAGRDVRRKQTRKSVARAICDGNSSPGYSTDRAKTCQAEIYPDIRKFGAVKVPKKKKTQVITKNQRFKISCQIEKAKVNPIVEMLQNDVPVTKGLTKNYRYRKNGVTHKLTFTPKGGFDESFEGNWTCRVHFLDEEKKITKYEEQLFLKELYEESSTPAPINKCEKRCGDDFCNNNGKCCMDNLYQVKKCECDKGHYGENCSKLNDASISILVSLGLVLLMGLIVLIWKKHKSQQPTSDNNENNDPRSNRTDETST